MNQDVLSGMVLATGIFTLGVIVGCLVAWYFTDDDGDTGDDDGGDERELVPDFPPDWIAVKDDAGV